MASSDDDLSIVLSDKPATTNTQDDLSAVMTANQQQSQTSTLNKIGYYAGLVNRGLMTGAGSAASLVGDPLVAGYNALAPKIGLPKSPMNVSQGVNALENKMGMPQPQNLGESLLTSGASVLGAIAVPVPLLDKLKPGTSQTLLNNSWSQAIGEDADKITSKVLNNAYNRMGDVFDAVRDETPRVLNTQKISSALSNIDEEFKGMLSDANANVTDHPLVQKFINFATDNPSSATGEQLGKLSSQLGKVSTKQFLSGDPDLGSGLSQVKELVDDAVEQGLSPEQSQAYGAARSQYRAMSQMLRSRALNTDTGDINPSTMGSFLERTDRTGYAMGNNTADHYMMTHAMRAQNAPSTVLGAVRSFQPANIPIGPIAAGAYTRGLFPPTVKGIAGAYEGLSQPEASP